MLIAQIGVVMFNVAILSALFSKTRNTIQTLLFIIIGAIEIYAYVSYFKQDNYYQQYQITRTFDSNELKKAYRQILLDNHPDVNSKVTSEQFSYLKNIYEILKNEEKKIQYDTYGVVNETNMNPLPAAIHRVKVTRIINYFILFLVVTVCTQEYKTKRKGIIFFLFFAGYSDIQIIDQPHYFENSQFFNQLTLFEFLIIYRIIISLIVAIQLSQIQMRERILSEKIKQFDQKTLQKLIKEHKEFITNQNSWKQLLINGFIIVILLLFSVSHFIDFTIFIDEIKRIIQSYNIIE